MNTTFNTDIKMKTPFNRAIFEQVDLDSGSISVLTTIVHKFAEPGTYPGIVMRENREVGNFTVVAEEPTVPTPSPESGEPITAAAPLVEPKQQVNLNLRELDISALEVSSERPLTQVMKAGGYAVFHVPSGPGGYSVRMCKKEKERSVQLFDSTVLDSNDLFSAMVLRPGTYSITNTVTKAEAKLVVAYPEIGKIPQRPVPVEVECTEETITPDDINIVPTQPLLFRFKTRSRIAIKLKEPNDGPEARPLIKKRAAREAKPSRRRIRYPPGLTRD